jgi:acid stress-induced BolA-like protein IbaG/YrbA
METVMERVRKVLRKEFSAKEILLQNAGGGMVGGWIISESFEDLTAQERQQTIWKLFDTYLNEKDRNRIVGFHTFTPLEKKWIFDEDFDGLKRPATKKTSSARKKIMTGRRTRSDTNKKPHLAGASRVKRAK